MATGTIKTKTDKGFGFIAVDGSADVFFHHSACNGQYDNLQIGESVQFDIEDGPKGPKASNVVAAKGGATSKSSGGASSDADAEVQADMAA
ncbi:MAG: cold shock domain-containing protein [Candidatus Peribacteraceae bacterium]|nr:cold shock domain-containing protein [Candidatus Peribacteraceae bacterium]